MADKTFETALPRPFITKVERTPTCWLWTAGADPQGYGRFKFDGRNQKAPRVVWACVFGEIPADLCVLHHCDTPRCVRPSHLFLGTRRDNNLDRFSKGREAKGRQLPQAKLSADSVRDIRQRIARGEAQVSIARSFCVSKATICEINKRKYWRHVAI
jgi:hypothetical protein